MKNNSIVDLKEFNFLYHFNTRFRDIDAFRHVNNSVFLTYFEDARRTFFERWNINLTDKSLIVASVKVDYLRQLTHPSELIIGQKVSRLGTTSFDIFSILFHNKTPVCTCTTTIVCYSFLVNEKLPLFEEVKKDFNF